MKKVMIVTGGGRGIGAATDRLAAQRGYAAGVNYLNNEAAALAVVKDVREAGGEPGRVDGVKQLVRLKRDGTVEEAAAAILWLLSDEAGHTTGAESQSFGAALRPKPVISWRARQESNLYQELRKLSFYPLNYGREEAVLYLKQESAFGGAAMAPRGAPVWGDGGAVTKGRTPALYNPAFARTQVGN